MRKEVRETFEKIKSLKVQGATDVALAALDSIKEIDEEEELNESIERLKESRPTEPLMRNGLRYVKNQFQEGRDIGRSVKEFKEMIENSIERITETGAEFMPEDATVMTHCHSGLVENIIKRAYQDGKVDRVIVTETRPKYQGRITAKRMAEEDIPVTIVVDSARREFIQEADLAIVGADVITSDGQLFNKIGTHEFALSADEIGKEFIVASELLKMDPMTLKGKREEIEERSKEEVWKNPPEGVEIRNFAFDATPPEYIDYVVTEEGIINSFDVIDNVRRKYPWVMK